jgi:hypothetical protein
MIQSLLWGFPYWIYQNQREAPAFPKDASSHDFARGDKIAWRDAFSATKGVCSCDQRFKPNCLGTLIYLDALHESLLSVYWYHRHTFTILYMVLLLSCWYYPVVCQWIYYLRLKFVGKITGESVWVSGFHISVTHWLEDFATSHGDWHVICLCNQWPCNRNLNWRYLPYVTLNWRPYVREYPYKIWPYMLQYLYFRILKFPLM